jgi:hypothetical protein
VELEFAEYFKKVWDVVPEAIVSDEHYDNNEELFQAITYDMYKSYDNTGWPEPQKASKLIQIVFLNILKIGYR